MLDEDYLVECWQLVEEQSQSAFASAAFPWECCDWQVQAVFALVLMLVLESVETLRHISQEAVGSSRIWSQL
jgi:hypothetical protein